ncbi:MAG TPA: DoxX family protein [Gammaproteobacteria bacterium]|nr:DoxX family protein [Gammaproteobacteria bacterium]
MNTLTNSISPPRTSPVPKARIWTGRALTALPVLFLLFDSAIKLVKIQPVTDAFVQLGFPDELARGIGVLELVCTVLYAVPSTSVLGAILLTGLFGGAMASHLRVGDPWLSHILFSIYLAVPMWLGLYLREERLHALLPLRTRRELRGAS